MRTWPCRKAWWTPTHGRICPPRARQLDHGRRLRAPPATRPGLSKDRGGNHTNDRCACRRHWLHCVLVGGRGRGGPCTGDLPYLPIDKRRPTEVWGAACHWWPLHDQLRLPALSLEPRPQSHPIPPAAAWTLSLLAQPVYPKLENELGRTADAAWRFPRYHSTMSCQRMTPANHLSVPSCPRPFGRHRGAAAAELDKPTTELDHDTLSLAAASAG